MLAAASKSAQSLKQGTMYLGVGLGIGESIEYREMTFNLNIKSGYGYPMHFHQLK